MSRPSAHTLLLAVAISLLWCGSSEAVVVGAGVLPHGDLALEPALLSFTNNSAELNAACVLTGEILGLLRPDVVFMTTPHGLANDIQFQINRHSDLEGFTELGIFPPYLPANPPIRRTSLSIPGDRAFAEDIVRALRSSPAGENVTGFLANEDRYPARLRWGEVTALKFLEDTVPLVDARTILMNIPARRLDQGFEMFEELLLLGGRIYDYLHSRPERIVYVVSADLAHTHLPDGPYGFSPKAQPFDDDMSLFMETMDLLPLMRAGPDLQEIFADGYTGLVLLGGLLQLSPVEWEPTLHANFHPTYYGMAAATYIPKA